MPILSIIIPTLNRGRLFRETVEQILRQPFSDFELIVVDQSDAPLRDENEAFMQQIRDERLRYVFIEEKNLPNARNEGLARASGEIVLFLDDDVILLTDEFLAAHVNAYKDPKIGGVTGRTVERSLQSNSGRTAMRVTAGGRTVINMMGAERCAIDGLKGANMSFRAAIFGKLGGFDRNFVGSAILEDIDISERATSAGWRLLFEPNAELLHLSAAKGGVRVTDELARERWRFQLTCYFILKHRGVPGLIPFTVVFTLIAVARAARWRNTAAPRELFKACRRGWEAWRTGSNQEIFRGLNLDVGQFSKRDYALASRSSVVG